MRIVPNGLQIRLMSEGDYQDIFRLYRQQSKKKSYLDEPEFARIFKIFSEAGQREAFVAVVHDRVIGFTTLYYMDVFHRCGKIASIQDLVVAEEFWGRGVDLALIDFVKQQVKQRHCRGLEVATDVWQSGVCSIYDRCNLDKQTSILAL